MLREIVYSALSGSHRGLLVPKRILARFDKVGALREACAE